MNWCAARAGQTLGPVSLNQVQLAPVADGCAVTILFAWATALTVDDL